ncbi:MAG TPA: NAD-dependent epimerase/dehydratase family protein [Candidatus Acidoferrales bacterium]|nr:NAD-dependent epimerase/dehydratase family protein [Candidatus Acidoferrales bacterium]
MRPTFHPPSSQILVTGGAGFIGSHLVERLLNDGHRVIVIDDFSTGSVQNLRNIKKNPRLKVIESRISECKTLGKWVEKSAFIFHLAATVGVDLVVKSALRVLESNFAETQALLETAVRNSTPILLTSTSEVYGKSAKSEFGEDDDLLIGPPNQSRWSYACAKLSDEFFALACAREKNLPVIVSRLFNTVGPRQTGRYGMVLPRFIAAAKENKPLRVFGDGRQTRCFCLVSDAVEALVRLKDCNSAHGEIFNIGGTEEVSILELAELVIKTLNSNSRIEFVPYEKAYAPGFDDMRRRKPRMEKLERFLNFCPQTPLVEIVSRTAEL